MFSSRDGTILFSGKITVFFVKLKIVWYGQTWRKNDFLTVTFDDIDFVRGS